MTANTDVSSAIVRSLVPARMDRLPWTRFHTRLVMSLGTAWILDGLEITLASSVAGVLTASDTLRLSSAAVGAIATVYLVGQVVGALVFGRLSDALGRRKLFMVTLGVYLFGSGLTAATSGAGPGWVAFLYLTRFIAGAGIGGEYAAINSAIDEMLPARYRGRVDIGVNGTYWAGSIIGTLVSLAFLNWIGPVVGWRLGFLAGPALAVVIVYVRRTLPESPRWLLTHGQAAEAERGIAGIEATVERDLGRPLPPVDSSQAIAVRPAKFAGYLIVLKLAFTSYWRRAVLGATLLITQSFLYNAIFFTYALVLTRFYGVSATMAPVYLIAFAAGNLAGPLVLGRLYDTIGRKPMIAGTYLASGAMLVISGYLFDQGMLTALTQTIAWCVIFFFASAGASSAYLTVSETFPVEIRAEAIAVFFAIAQVFGAVGPILFGALIGAGNNPSRLFIGYAIGGTLMIVGGIVELRLGVAAERRELEQIARPLTAVTATQVPRAPMPRAHYSPSSKPAGLGGFDDHPRLPLSSGKRKTPRKRPSPPGSASHAGSTDTSRVSPGGTAAAPRSAALSPGEEHLMAVAGRRNPPRGGGSAVQRLAAGTRRLVPDALRRDPQDRWAAVFGRIAGYSFAVAVVSGVLLLPFFRPSMATVVYHGSYSKLDGVPMSQAYQSVLATSFDVRGGLLIRQVHHWSADLFVAAICLRLLRVFFRGRFCGRALPDWLIWVTLLPLGMLTAYSGTILPDDGLSGGSLSVITGVLLSLPVIGTHLVSAIFGGAPPGHQIIGRDYWVHILVLPVLAGALLLASFRPSLRWPRRPDPLLPFTCAVLVLLGGVAQINPVWLIGPYQPGSISSGAVPDWYMGFLDGALRTMPAWELTVAGHPLALGVLIPALVLPGLFFTCLFSICLALYPLADRRIAGGRPPRGLLPPTPADPANRTAVGVAGVTLYGLLWAAAANDQIAYHLHIPLYTVTWIFRVLVLAGPALAFLFTRVICHALADRRRDEELRGRETGRIVQNPQGGYDEIREPVHPAAPPTANPPGPAIAR